MLFATGCDTVNVYCTFAQTCNRVRVVFGVDNYSTSVSWMSWGPQWVDTILHGSPSCMMHVQCSLPYQIDFVSFLHLHLICFYIFRFWTVCTVWTCSCYRAPGAKPVIPHDWALLYRYEWSVLLEKYILCFSIRNSASKMLKFFQHHKYTPSSLFYYFFFLIVFF